MALDLADYDRRARDAVRVFWRSRAQAREKQAHTGLPDQGERGSVTGGKNMDGFIDLVVDLVKANGLPHASIHRKVSLLTLPGYFRPTKRWDLLVFDENHLVAAIELKSQVGPSFGNNFNNRAEEAVGSAADLWTAYREGAFGDQARPFVGWLTLVEDAPASRRPVRCETPHFPVFPVFEGASYLKRYDLLCRRLVRERLYTTAAVISSPRSAAGTGEYERQSEMTGLRTFVRSLAGHIAAEAARERA
ncbi:MAG: restriction endonuclease [Gemmatimonadetes bacterium]|nr:restriction endonuclease [Gemmatimonadota bacterium]MYE17790.1 restriction endonuclease [Gemmatimonadota bacterium]